MKNGVPFDVAFALNEDESLAYAVIFGEMEGGEFDWTDVRWMER